MPRSDPQRGGIVQGTSAVSRANMRGSNFAGEKDRAVLMVLAKNLGIHQGLPKQ